MSLCPWFAWYSRRPSRMLDQHFGLGLDNEDIWPPFTSPQELGAPIITSDYYRPWRSYLNSSRYVAKQDSGQFMVNLDVQQFAPNEITVKDCGGNEITIEAKHEEREDEHGFVSRHFIRRYVLPNGFDINRAECKLSSDGILSLTAPKIEESVQCQNVPIVPTENISKSEEKTSLDKGDVN